jgi:hypothetical protein
MTTFTNYDAAEAERIAGALALQKNPLQDDTALWTEWVLDKWTRTAKPGLQVDARPSRVNHDKSTGKRFTEQQRRSFDQGWDSTRNTAGEFLVDLSHSSFPCYQQADWSSVDYWNQVFEKDQAGQSQERALKLVLESEFGSQQSPDLNLHRVMEDACKLWMVKASIKVMVFASTNGDNRTNIMRFARQVIAADTTAEQAWVWIDLPWGDWTDLNHRPEVVICERKVETTR